MRFRKAIDRNRWTTLLMANFFWQNGFCQPVVSRSSNVPLHRFFQQHFDSTVICSTWSGWGPWPHYKIIAKKGSRLYSFTYQQPFGKYTGGVELPGGLTEKFFTELQHFKNLLPDTNRFFLPYPATAQKVDTAWRTISQYAWQMPNDTLSTCILADDAANTDFWLITKKAEKYLTYYDLEERISCVGANSRLRFAIKVKKTFERVLE